MGVARRLPVVPLDGDGTATFGGGRGLENQFEPLLDASRTWTQARLAELDPDLERARHVYRDADESWDRFGNVLERGHALLGLGRCLLALGSGGEATPIVREARELFAGLRARRLETEATLAETVRAARP